MMESQRKKDQERTEGVKDPGPKPRIKDQKSLKNALKKNPVQRILQVILSRFVVITTSILYKISFSFYFFFEGFYHTSFKVSCKGAGFKGIPMRFKSSFCNWALDDAS